MHIEGLENSGTVRLPVKDYLCLSPVASGYVVTKLVIRHLGTWQMCRFLLSHGSGSPMNYSILPTQQMFIVGSGKLGNRAPVWCGCISALP